MASTLNKSLDDSDESDSEITPLYDDFDEPEYVIFNYLLLLYFWH